MLKKAFLTVVLFVFLFLGSSFIGDIYGLGSRTQALGPYTASSTDSRFWYKMDPVDNWFGRPMLYDAFYNGIGISTSKGVSSNGWIQIEIYSEAGVTNAWTDIDEYEDPSLESSGNGMFGEISVSMSYGNMGGKRITLTLSDDITEPFLLFALNSKGHLFLTTVYPENLD